MKKPKVYSSKLGKKFSIVGISQPRDKDGVIFLTRDEWDWIRAKNLDSKEFDLLLQFKIDDYRHPIITEEVLQEKQSAAIRYGNAIREMLTGGKKSELNLEKKENEKLHTAPGKLPEGGEGHNRIKTWVDRTSGAEHGGEDDDFDSPLGSPAGQE